MIKIELSEEDAELFKIFRKYQDQIQRLKDDGILELRQGKAVIHKGMDGEVKMTEVIIIKRH